MAAQAKSLTVTDGARLALMDPGDELGRLGASFNRVLDRLSESQQQQRRFLADAAHELRAPLARLRSHAEMGRSAVGQATDADVRPEAAQALVAVEREVAAASETVGGLLAIARAEAGSAAVHLADGVLDDLIADCLARWQESAELAGVELTLGTFEEVHASFDATLVRQLLGALLDNAIHYTPRGGRITVHLLGTDTEVILRVEDEGIGIAHADREQVFARFFRAPAARARRPDGSGLGLALARWIVEQHQGTIIARDRGDGQLGVVIEAVWPKAFDVR
jgi:two-component system OmpR family sensor kinase